MIKKAVAFIKRDFLIMISYKLHFLLQMGSIFSHLIIFYFISKLLDKSPSAYLQEFGGNYFPFVLIGIAFSGFLTAALHSFANNIRREQMMGTLEAMISTPTKLWNIIICSSLWNFIFASISVVVYLLFGGLLGVDFSSSNFFGAFIVLILTVIVFSSIGIIASSFIMVFKRGNPVASLISMVSSVLGGVYFPIKVFPESIQFFSRLIPLTYSLRSIRLALIKGYPISYFYNDILILLLFIVILLPLGLLCFRFAVRKAKIDGSLLYY